MTESAFDEEGKGGAAKPPLPFPYYKSARVMLNFFQHQNNSESKITTYIGLFDLRFFGAIEKNLQPGTVILLGAYISFCKGCFTEKGY
jgi:hypothetical protein